MMKINKSWALAPLYKHILYKPVLRIYTMVHDIKKRKKNKSRNLRIKTSNFLLILSNFHALGFDKPTYFSGWTITSVIFKTLWNQRERITNFRMFFSISRWIIHSFNMQYEGKYNGNMIIVLYKSQNNFFIDILT